MNRREVLQLGALGAAGTLVGASGLGLLGSIETPSRVGVMHADSYDRDLIGELQLLIADAIGPRLQGARCVVKPNLVEFIPNAPVNTNPAVLNAVCTVLKNLGASEVLVGEGPGHRRDVSYMLKRSGYLDIIDSLHLDYVDLNLDDITEVLTPRNVTGLGKLSLPKTIVEADIVVSLAKMKLHKWVGATLTMKNLFGCAPSAVYGWPKNTLHYRGIARSILDLCDCIQPDLCIVDGVVGMEGYAPIQGDPVKHGVIVVGTEPRAVDATACRLMGVNPMEIVYLVHASRAHGHIRSEHITMTGENWSDLRVDYSLMKRWKHLRLRSS